MKILTTTKNKLRLAWQWLAGQFILIGHWFRNLAILIFSTNSRVRVFEGWAHYWFAQKWANKRTRISRINKYCGGKWHYVIPAGNYSLAVLSSLEIRDAKKKGLLNKHLSIDTILKSAYYVSTDQNSKPNLKN